MTLLEFINARGPQDSIIDGILIYKGYRFPVSFNARCHMIFSTDNTKIIYVWTHKLPISVALLEETLNSYIK